MQYDAYLRIGGIPHTATKLASLFLAHLRSLNIATSMAAHYNECLGYIDIYSQHIPNYFIRDWNVLGCDVVLTGTNVKIGPRTMLTNTNIISLGRSIPIKTFESGIAGFLSHQNRILIAERPGIKEKNENAIKFPKIEISGTEFDMNDFVEKLNTIGINASLKQVEDYNG